MSTITTRSGKGSPLTNNEIDDNFTNLNTDKYQSGDTPTFAGLTTTADISLGDNDKANFGASNDLQIYHNGAHSLIDNNTGNLYILTDGTTYFANSANSENYATFNQDGAVTLYYDSAVKLATTTTGIDVTGTAEMDTLSIGGTAVTATAAELNILDGVTATAAELNILDGVTATAAELNYNDITTLGTVEASKTVTADANADVKWGDSDKAIFGAGSDLQIYHDGSNSHIVDTATGSLYLSADTNVNITAYGTGENMATFVKDGAVTLYYDNSAKLATTTDGISVTGKIFASSYTGLDSGDFLSWADNTYLDVTINSNHKFRFEADGDLHADGDVIAYSTTVSDSRLKDNIQNIEGALAKVNSISGVTFIRKNTGEKAAGVIAQELIEVLPEAVKEKSLPLQTGTDDKYYVVEYDAVTGLLVEAIKELTKRVEELEK